MLQALTPKCLRRFSRVGISIVIGALWPLVVLAQEPKKGATPAPAPAATKAAEDAPPTAAPLTPDEQAEAGVVDVATAKKFESIELFKDPRAEAILAFDKFPQLPQVRGAPTLEEIKKMAVGVVPFNRDVIPKFVDAEAANLTNHSTLRALLNPNPEGNQKSQRETAMKFTLASEALMAPLDIPAVAVNQQFRQVYTRSMNTMPKLLSNQLHVRTVAMTLLAKTNDSDAIPIFVKALNDPDQVATVKDWAAQGITRIAQNGRRDVDVGKANVAAKALSDFLQREPETFWLIQARALQALGSLRLATDPQGQGLAEMGGAALKYLADPNMRPYVRAWAAWALGMMKTQPVAGFNYSLVAYHIGQASLDIGQRIVALYEERTEEPKTDTKTANKKKVVAPKKEVVALNADRAVQLTGLLLFEIMPAFRGQDGVRESGLLNAPALANSRKSVSDISNRIQAVAVAAFNLSSVGTPRSERPVRKEELAKALADLKKYLAENPPSNTHLVPSGPDFPQVAGAAAK